MAIFPDAIASASDLLMAANNSYALLTADINSSATTIPLSSTALFPASGVIWLDNECIKYTSKDSTNLYLDSAADRGYDSTAAAAHLSGIYGYGRRSACHHNLLREELIAIEQYLYDSVIDMGFYGTDDVAIQEAFDGASDGDSVRFVRGVSYTIAAQVTTDKELVVDAYGAQFNVTDNVTAFYFYVAPTDVKALSASYVPGNLFIAVTSMAAALTAGQPFRIVSDAIDIANRDTGSSTSQWRTAEWAHAGSGSTTTNIVLNNPLRFSKGVSIISSPGEESIVDAYQVGYNARILVPSLKTMKWYGGTITYDSGHESTPWNAKAFLVCGYNQPVIRDLHITKGYSHGVSLAGTYKASVEDCFISDLTNNPTNSQYGYGVSDGGYMTRVHHCAFRNCRHGYTSGASTATAGTTSNPILLTTGRMVGAVISNCSATAFGTGGFDTHHESEDATFQNCIVDGGDYYGFTIRGRNIAINDCRAINTTGGIIVFTEYQGGDTNDDYYVAGKPYGYTTASIRNFYADVTSIPVAAETVRRLDINGLISRSTNHVMIDNTGSYVVVDGLCRHTTTTFDGTRAITEVTGNGCFELNPIPAAAVSADWTAKFLIARGADIHIDASICTDSSPTNNLALIKLSNNTVYFENRGRIYAKLSPAFSYLYYGTAANATADKFSVIEFEADGVPDNFLDENLTGTKLRARALDRSYSFDGTDWTSISADTDNLDAHNLAVVYVTTTGGNVVIGGITGGRVGQVLHIAKATTANTLTIEHNEGVGAQNIYLNSAADKTISGYGGISLMCTASTAWIEIGG